MRRKIYCSILLSWALGGACGAWGKAHEGGGDNGSVACPFAKFYDGPGRNPSGTKSPQQQVSQLLHPRQSEPAGNRGNSGGTFSTGAKRN